MNDIQKLRNNISKDFLDFYSDISAEIKTPMALKFEEDPTLFFTNCSICLFKRDYIKSEKITSYITVQECLRTNNYSNIRSNCATDYRWNTSLYMMGGFIPIRNDIFKEELLKLINKQTRFYMRWINENTELKIKIHSKFSEFLKYSDFEGWNSRNITYTFNSKTENELEWKYGLDRIKGIGVEWVVQENDIEFVLGNVILMFKKEEIIGIDFGGGLEILIQHILNLPYKIFASYYVNNYIYKVLSVSMSNIKVVDTIATLIDIIIETKYLKETNVRIKDTYNQYANILMNLIKENNFQNDFLLTIAKSIYSQKSRGDIDNKKLSSILKDIIENKEVHNCKKY